MHMNTLRHHSRGFSLIEVLVALVIIGVGMLGIAKIQALAYASTGTAASRSIAAIEAASLAAAMRANRDYWTTAAAGANQTITFQNGAIKTSTDGTLLAPGACAAAPCSMQQLAAYDLSTWATSLNSVLYGSNGTITCLTPTAATPAMPAGSPVGCTIQILWSERNVGINSQSQTTTMVVNPYTLYVEP